MAIPEPLCHFLRAFYLTCPMVIHGLPLFIAVHLAQLLCVAPADNEDVAGLERDALVFCDIFDVFDVYAETGEGGVGDAFGFGVGFEINKDASSGEAAVGVPVCALD